MQRMRVDSLRSLSSRSLVMPKSEVWRSRTIAAMGSWRRSGVDRVRTSIPRYAPTSPPSPRSQTKPRSEESARSNGTSATVSGYRPTASCLIGQPSMLATESSSARSADCPTPYSLGSSRRGKASRRVQPCTRARRLEHSGTEVHVPSEDTLTVASCCRWGKYLGCGCLRPVWSGRSCWRALLSWMRRAG